MDCLRLQHLLILIVQNFLQSLQKPAIQALLFVLLMPLLLRKFCLSHWLLRSLRLALEEVYYLQMGLGI